MQYDNSKSKVHRIQKRLLNEYWCKLDIHDSFEVEMLRRKFIAADIIVKGDYNTYLRDYHTLSQRADELGVNISSPLDNPKIIKEELIKLLAKGGLTSTSEVKELLKPMKVIDEKADTRLSIGEKARESIRANAKFEELKKILGLEENDDFSDDDWNNIECPFCYDVGCDRCDDSPEKKKQTIKDIFEEMEQQQIDEYNSQL